MAPAVSVSNLIVTMEVPAALAVGTYPQLRCQQRTIHASHCWSPFVMPPGPDTPTAQELADALEWSYCPGRRPRPRRTP